MARSVETLSSLPDYAEIKKAPSRARIIQLLQEGHQLRKAMTEADERMKEIKNELAQIQLLHDLPGVRYEKLCFVAVEREGRSSLSKELLIDNGVPPNIITMSMKKGASYLETRLEVMEDK